MSYNIVDTNLIQINEELKINILKIGDHTNHTLLVIDDFLKNPDDLLSIIKSQPIEKEKGKWSHSLNLKFPQIRQAFNYLAREHFGITHVENIFDDINLQFNLTSGGSLCNYTDLVPHIDEAFCAFSIFLNKDEDCQGGTGFYKHVKTGLDYNVEYFDSEFKKSDNYWLIYETYRKIRKHDYEVVFDSRVIDTNDWELQLVADAKFNRFVMYPAYIFHTAYIEKDWYQNEDRVTLTGFIK